MNRFTIRTTSDLIILLAVKETQQAKHYSTRRAVALKKIVVELTARNKENN